MKCFYHRQDLDGQCSGAIIYDKYRSICDLIGINYGESFPWDTIKNGETIFIVDFSLPREEMQKLDSVAHFIWIDHHDTAIQEMKGLDIKGIQRNGTGACALVWEYEHTIPVPEGVKLLAQYDVWNHTNPKTLPFQYAMGLEYTFPDADIWESVFNSDSIWILKMVNNGKLLQKKIEKDNNSYVKAYGFKTEFEGYSAIAVNRGMVNSKIFDSIEEDYDIMMTFAFHRDGNWKFSLYTDKDYIHCGEIAKKYGGGGHKQAAGFHLSSIPESLLKVNK